MGLNGIIMKLVVSEMKKPIYFILFLLLLLPLFAAPQHAYAQIGTVVRIDPASILVDPGQSFSVEIVIEDVSELNAFDISVQYDPDKLDFVNAELGDFLEQGFSFQLIDEDLGVVNVINSQSAPSIPESGSGTLFTIHFLTRSIEGLTNLEILEPEGMPLLSDHNGIEIPCELEHGTVTIGDVPDEQFYSFLPMVMH